MNSSQKKDKKRIVILGAGYAGMFFATNLDNYLEADKTEILIIDRNPYHQLLQEIHLVAAGFRTAKEVRIPVSSLIAGKDIRFIQSDVKMILPDRNAVIIDSTEIEYDFLVISLGASTRYFNIEGAEKNTLPLRSISDASFIYNKIIELQNNANFNSSNVKKNIVIVGGGATGSSLAGALSDLIGDMGNANRWNIIIVEALPTILPGWNERVVRKAEEILNRKGVKLMTNSSVLSVRPDNDLNYNGFYGNSVYLDTGLTISSSLTIWTAGVRGYDIKVKPEIEKTKDGRIIVNEYCQSSKYNNIFAIGDIAAVKSPNGRIYPPLAQIAVRQARYLAKSLPLHINNRVPDESFEYNIKAQLLSLGQRDYVGVFNNYVISGDIANVVEEFTKSAYLRSLLSGGSDIATNVYENDLFSQALAGITFAGFTFTKAIKKIAH